MKKMKKKFVILALGLVCMSFTIDTSKKIKCINSTAKVEKQEDAVRAYVRIQNEWIEGFVFINNGLVTRCQFKTIDLGNMQLRADIYQATRPSSLNPNNPLAIKNNFTHFIDIPNYGRAYFSM